MSITILLHNDDNPTHRVEREQIMDSIAISSNLIGR